MSVVKVTILRIVPLEGSQSLGSDRYLDERSHHSLQQDFAIKKIQIVLDATAKPGCKRLQAWRIISAQLGQSCVVAPTP